MVKYPLMPPADRFTPYASDIFSGQLEREARAGGHLPQSVRSVIVSDNIDDFAVSLS